MGYFDDLLPTTQAPQTYIRQGASVISPAKQATATMGTAYRSLLVPTDFLQVSAQGATPEQILVNAWGACGTATGESLTVAGPYLGSQGTDSLGLAIPSAPQPGDSIRVTRFSRTSTRAITHKIAKQKQQPFLQDMRPLDGIIIKHYGTYSFVDANGVTHQPPGKRDPVVQLPGVGSHIDMDTLKFGPNGEMYADFFGTGGATGTGSAGQSVNGLNAGHGIEIIPGFSPTDSPLLTIEAGGSVPAASLKWAYCYVIDGKRTPLSPWVTGTTVDGPPTDYHQPHLLIPGKPDIIHATALELYRADASIDANGTIQTKFAYTTTPGVLISDGSTAATKIESGAYTGMYQYTVLSTHTGVDVGDEFEYNPLVRVKAGDPPIPYDPRDGSLTTLIESGANDGSSIFKTKDGGAFNQVTGAITYPEDNPLNHSGFRLVDSLTPSHDPQDYIDTKTDADLGILFQRDPTVINVKPARYLAAPFSSMSPVPGTVPPVYELSGVAFSSATPTISNDGLYVNAKYGTVIDKNNFLDVLLSASLTIPTAGQGAQTTSTVPGYDTAMYKKAGLQFQGASGRELAVAYNPATLELDNQDRLNVIGGGGGGGGGTGSATSVQVTSTVTQNLSTASFGSFATTTLTWDAAVFDTNGMWSIGQPTRLTALIDGIYRVVASYSLNISLLAEGGGTGGGPDSTFTIGATVYNADNSLYQRLPGSARDANGTDLYLTVEMDVLAKLTAGQYVVVTASVSNVVNTFGIGGATMVAGVPVTGMPAFFEMSLSKDGDSTKNIYSAVIDGDQALPVSTTTIIDFATPLVDQGDAEWIPGAASDITVPKSAIYRIAYNFEIDLHSGTAQGDWFRVYIKLNGTDIYDTLPITVDGASPTMWNDQGEITLPLIIGDVITFYVDNETSRAQALFDGTGLSNVSVTQVS